MAAPRGFERATITRIVQETPDARTFVLKPHGEPFAYQAGQFCTFKVTVDGRMLLRSYSMSSAPETDAELMTTVKRVPGGKVSNWMHDNLAEGDEVELMRPSGSFCLRAAEGPMLGFSGGSGITPIISLAKSVLATTERRVRLLCADRDRPSAIFDRALADLAERSGGRLAVVRHLDAERGLLDAAAVQTFVGGDGAGDAYICGPEPFMALVESAFPGPGRIFSERFGGGPAPTPPSTVATPAPVTSTIAVDDAITIRLGNRRVTVPRQTDETLLETARRAGLAPPFNCQAGNCGTCIARLTEGSARMRVNDVLTDEEIAEGYILTCQGVPGPGPTSVHYED
jgi:ferredoxin-NADP reductase